MRQSSRKFRHGCATLPYRRAGGFAASLFAGAGTVTRRSQRQVAAGGPVQRDNAAARGGGRRRREPGDSDESEAAEKLLLGGLECSRPLSGGRAGVLGGGRELCVGAGVCQANYCDKHHLRRTATAIATAKGVLVVVVRECEVRRGNNRRHGRRCLCMYAVWSSVFRATAMDVSVSGRGIGCRLVAARLSGPGPANARNSTLLLHLATV